ncbi:MAG: hypothetical protein RIC87_00180 [Kiloniellales bacterium]
MKWGILAALLIYVLAILGPYLRSTLVRNAAVSAWVKTATATIYGQVEEGLQRPGSLVGDGGVLATLVNPQADRSALDIAAGEARQAEAEVEAARHLVSDLDKQLAQMRSDYERYRVLFREDLQLDLVGTERRLERIAAELVLLRTLADRASRLSSRGFAAQSDRDEAALRVAALERLQAELDAKLARLKLRLRAADESIYLMDDGAEPSWAGTDRDAIERVLSHARSDLAAAEARLESAWADSDAADASYRLVRRSQVRVPPGSMIWSVVVGEGATLEVGDPIADWIDCGALLVDVPMADAELALLLPGMTADVVLEGESEARSGRVLLTRGAAAVLGRADLAAVSKARGSGGQVILSLEASPGDRATCPVGRAAFVDFHDIGLLDVIAARLRLR